MTNRNEIGHVCRLTVRSCLALTFLATACLAQQPPSTSGSAEAAIRAADEKWSKAASAGDLEGTLSYYSDDASVLSPNAPIASGKQAIRAVWSSLLTSGTSVSWEADKVEVARSGELGYVVGTYEVNAEDPQGKPVTDRGKMVEVWKKQADGKWKAVVDIFNSDLPATTAAESK